MRELKQSFEAYCDNYGVNCCYKKKKNHVTFIEQSRVDVKQKDSWYLYFK